MIPSDGDRYELRFHYRNGQTNHDGPFSSLELARNRAKAVITGCPSLLLVYIIPYSAGSFEAEAAIETLGRWEACPTCSHPYDQYV